MSELINKNDNRATIRWKLLTGASAMALTAYVASSGIAQADDTDRPTIWIELGGQMETLQGLNAPFSAPFMTAIAPTPDVYKGADFLSNQDAPKFSFGEEGKLTFQPEDSSWNFSAGIRYGRSHSKRHTHKQIGHPTFQYTHYTKFVTPSYHYTNTSVRNILIPTAALADTEARSSERHLILDFTAGKDVGLGLFGRNSSSTVNAGVRFASFRTSLSAYVTGRPAVNFAGVIVTGFYGYLRANEVFPTFHQYILSASAVRSFKGVGPTLSWEASAPIAGSEQDGELALDWGINGAVLFGKQKAKTSHSSRAYHKFASAPSNHVTRGYAHTPLVSKHSTRSRNVTVPNFGGSVGMSYKYTNFKFSLGYRYDTFLNAMDMGIDTAKKSNLTFNGPYASISIGLGD